MKRLLLVVLVLSLAHSLTADSLQKVRSIVKDQQKAADVPGLLMGIWQNDEPILLLTNGVADSKENRPIQPSDHMRIGSITKSFTITRLLQLAEEGELDLDDPVEKYVPNVQNGTATLRQLANMTSGIFNYTQDSNLVEALFQNLQRVWTPEELVEVAERNQPDFPPGEGWHYSNTNTVLLGMVIEKVTGNKLGVEISEHVLGPLLMENTFYPYVDTLPEPYAEGYALLNPEEGLTDLTISSPSASAGSGAMISTLDDLRIWARALALGELLTDDMQEKRLQLVSTEGHRDSPDYDLYGLGIGSIAGWIGHTGDYLGYQSLTLYDPETDRSIVILVNLFSGEHIPTKIFREIVTAIPVRQ